MAELKISIEDKDTQVKFNEVTKVKLQDGTVIEATPIPNLDEKLDVDTLLAPTKKFRDSLIPTLIEVPEYKDWKKSKGRVKQSKYTHKQYQAIRRKKNKRRHR